MVTPGTHHPPWKASMHSSHHGRLACTLRTMVARLSAHHGSEALCPPWYPGYTHREACCTSVPHTGRGRHVCAEVPITLRRRASSRRVPILRKGEASLRRVLSLSLRRLALSAQSSLCP